MQVQKINNNPYSQPYKQRTLSTDITFGIKFKTGDYSEKEVELAKKYLDKNDFVKQLRDDIWEQLLSGWERFWGDIDIDTIPHLKKVVKLMDELRNDKISEKSKSIADINKSIEELKSSSNSQKEANAKLEEELENINAQVISRAGKISALKIKQKKIKAIQEYMDRYIMNVKLEHELQKENPKATNIALSKLNGVMVTGIEDSTWRQLLNWIGMETKQPISFVDFNKFSQKEVLKAIKSHSSKAEETNQRSILVLENIEKYTIASPENNSFIAKLKNYLQQSSSKYKTNVFVHTEVPEKLNSEVVAEQRFPIKINVSDIRPEVKFSKTDYGYKLNDETLKDIYLYLGDSGYNRNILWVDSSVNEDIQKVLDNIDKIKEIDLFKDVHIIQCRDIADKNNLMGFSKLSGRFTYEYQQIYEKFLR